jgi:hypothetical protein
LVTTNSVAKAVTQNIENGNYLLTKINGKPVRELLDTGFGSTFINSSLARKLKLPIRPVQKSQLSCLFAAEGSKLNMEGVTDITFIVSGFTYYAHSIRSCQHSGIANSGI